MKQSPSNLKYKKYHKVNNFYLVRTEKKLFTPVDGQFGLQAVEAGKLKFKQIEACRRTLKRGLAKTDKMWIKVFTNVAVTKKPIASRMGKGKGNIAHWIAPIAKGQLLFEVAIAKANKAKLIFKKAQTKLPIKTKFLKIFY